MNHTPSPPKRGIASVMASVPAAAWGIWGITSLFYGFQFFLRSSPNAMKLPLMEAFHLDVQWFGIFTAAYYWAYSLLQIPVGMLLDTWGPKHVLRWGMILCVAGAILFNVAPFFGLAVLGRCLIGAGAAVSFIGSVRMNTLWFPPTCIAIAIGLLSSVGKIGGALSNAVLPKWIAWSTSWHEILWILTGLGAFLTVLLWIFGKNGPKDKFSTSGTSLQGRELWGSLMQVLKSSIVWKVGLYGYAMYLTLSVFSDGYSIAFLQESLGVPQKMAEDLACLTPLGSCFGAAIVSYLSDYFKRRVLFLRLCALLTLFCSSLVFFGPAFSPPMAALCLFGFGFCSGGQILIFTIAAQSFPIRLAGIAVGVVNSILMAGGALHNPLVGTILKWTGGHALWDYRMAFCSLSLFFGVAFILSLYIPENYPKPSPTEP